MGPLGRTWVDVGSGPQGYRVPLLLLLWFAEPPSVRVPGFRPVVRGRGQEGRDGFLSQRRTVGWKCPRVVGVSSFPEEGDGKGSANGSVSVVFGPRGPGKAVRLDEVGRPRRVSSGVTVETRETPRREFRVKGTYVTDPVLWGPRLVRPGREVGVHPEGQSEVGRTVTSHQSFPEEPRRLFIPPVGTSTLPRIDKVKPTLGETRGPGCRRSLHSEEDPGDGPDRYDVSVGETRPNIVRVLIDYPGVEPFSVVPCSYMIPLGCEDKERNEPEKPDPT